MKQEEAVDHFDTQSRITNPNVLQEEDLYNSAPYKNQNYSLSKINENYWENIESNLSSSKNKKLTITEPFIDENGVLAVFLSSKNDIIEPEYEFDQDNNINRYSNVNNVNYIPTEENYLQQTMDKKNIKYFSKTNRSRTLKDDFKQISLDTQTINEHTIQYCNQMVDLIQSTENKINNNSNHNVIFILKFRC
jgi:hypothetical protein